MSTSHLKGLKIAVVDDHAIVRESIVDSLNKHEGYFVTIEARHGQDFIDQLNRTSLPDLVILDLSMPVMDGKATAKWLHEHFPNVYILALTMFDSDVAMISMYQFGVRGFLHKDITRQELKCAIDMTMQTGFYYSPRTMLNLLKQTDSGILVNNTLITTNEIRLMELVGTDKNYKEISAEMKMNNRTVDWYRDSLFAKLNIKTRAALVLYAVRNAAIKLFN